MKSENTHVPTLTTLKEVDAIVHAANKIVVMGGRRCKNGAIHRAGGTAIKVNTVLI
jgi:O-acetyl-ADP-ribose deacetylase (regulator of RNase III)